MVADQRESWVCSACRSINGRRTGTCYRCRAPRELTAAAPETLPTLGREQAPAAVNPYRSSRMRAEVASAALVGAHAATTALVLWLFRASSQELDAPVLSQPFPEMAAVAALWLAVAFALTIAWGAWISRVVDNMPALGLGYARSSPKAAFFENFFVGANLFLAPARFREVAAKLDETGRAPALVNLSWLVVAGPPILFTVITRFARWVFGPDVLNVGIHAFLPVFWGCATVGIVLAIVVIFRVERLSAERSEAMGLAGGSAPS
jgi:hypothetical protein